MQIETELFFELLHRARALHGQEGHRYLRGYRDALRMHLEDIKTGREIQAFWIESNSGAYRNG